MIKVATPSTAESREPNMNSEATSIFELAVQKSLALLPTSLGKIARKLTKQHQYQHYRVLSMLSENASLESILKAIVNDVEVAHPQLRCSIRLTGGFDAYGDVDAAPLCLFESIVSDQGQLLGTFVISSAYAGLYDARALELVRYGARLAAVAIQKHAEQRELRLASSVFEHSKEGIMVTDAGGVILKVNKTFSSITGFDMHDALGRKPRMLRSSNQANALFPLMYQALADSGHWNGEICNRHKLGFEYTSHMAISAVFDTAGIVTHYVSTFADVTQAKRHADQLNYIAHYDSLTGLPNRVLLADRLQQAIVSSDRHQRALAVGFLDLDGFKAINDACGHGTGDALLSVLSLRMQAELREGDTLARFGGDEFVVVLADMLMQQDYQAVMERLLRAASSSVTIGSQLLRVSASIGVTVYPSDRSDADLLIRHADQSMYQAKQLGRNRYHLFDVAEEVEITTRQHSLLQIEQALINQEMVLFYQPKVNMHTRQFIGVEALIRWQHPERGLLLPGEFLPLIENHVLNEVLGHWVIRTALAQMSHWQALGLQVPVSVNVSACHLQQDLFLPQLQALLAHYPDYQRNFLELEILETSVLQDIVKITSVLKACAKIGVRSALDDFGTGYSSLAHLKCLPSEVIKIDRYFVQGLLDDSGNLEIVKGIIGLARAFGREVIAEGVETDAHARLLIELGCVQGQGFGIGRPMPAAGFSDWLEMWRRASVGYAQLLT